MAVYTGTVAAVNWLNWIGYPTVVKDDTEVLAGTLLWVRYQPNGGIFDLSIGGAVVRYNGTQQINLATPADASQALYGRSLTPQTP